MNDRNMERLYYVLNKMFRNMLFSSISSGKKKKGLDVWIRFRINLTFLAFLCSTQEILVTSSDQM